MSVLEQLYRLEMEFHRLTEAQSISELEAESIHTSYALQQGYEPLLRTVGVVDTASLAATKDRMAGLYGPRRAEAAFRFLRQLLPLSA
ncbi:MAG: hypothetical protein ABS79_03140 [Planctomycetes bacterium SCN 63-9]|nr:MAG: hypothetical protein ABS79_03140 [Planctomycetes bacterium SCN 63-9]